MKIINTITCLFLCTLLVSNAEKITLKKSLEDRKSLGELWFQTYKITIKEGKALGIFDASGRRDFKAFDKWLDPKSGESGIYSRKNKILSVRAYESKLDSISSLLFLYRQGYKVPTLFSPIKEAGN